MTRGDGENNAIGEPLPLTGGASWSSIAPAQGRWLSEWHPETGLWMLPADTNQITSPAC
jgi:hypothetical protein